MLKKIRIALAIVFFLLITLLFFDFTGTLHLWLGWTVKVQLIPAILAVNILVIIGLALLTLVFGRAYCSVICPLGVFQDGVSNVSGRRKGKKNRFGYSPALSWLRYSILAVFIIALVAGFSVIVSLLDPYAAYGRIASNLLAPLYYWGNNLLAWFAERADSYAFYGVEVWLKSCLTFVIAIVTLIVTGILAWRNGRTYCNTVCPVGACLGFISRFSVFKIALDKEKCTGCKLCERKCKASCIDVDNKQVDHSRCVTCFNCVESCKFGALTYTFRKAEKTPPVTEAIDDSKGVSRRKMLSVMALVTVGSAVKAQQLQVDGGLATIEDKKIPNRKTPLVPPGAKGIAHLKQHCTACQLCVSACPNQVLRPSNKLATLMQPEMSYERGYCRPECVECSLVCPAKAIRPVTTADKSAIAIGQAVWIKDNCVVNRDNVPCDSCQRHCPTGAITLVDREPGNSKSLKIPVVNPALCIGCGACENLCPARPFSAIYVEGNVQHHAI